MFKPNPNGDLSKAQMVLRNVLETFLSQFEPEFYDDEVSIDEVKWFVDLLMAQEVTLQYFGQQSEKEVSENNG